MPNNLSNITIFSGSRVLHTVPDAKVEHISLLSPDVQTIINSSWFQDNVQRNPNFDLAHRRKVNLMITEDRIVASQSAEGSSPKVRVELTHPRPAVTGPLPSEAQASKNVIITANNIWNAFRTTQANTHPSSPNNHTATFSALPSDEALRTTQANTHPSSPNSHTATFSALPSDEALRNSETSRQNQSLASEKLQSENEKLKLQIEQEKLRKKLDDSLDVRNTLFDQTAQKQEQLNNANTKIEELEKKIAELEDDIDHKKHVMQKGGNYIKKLEANLEQTERKLNAVYADNKWLQNNLQYLENEIIPKLQSDLREVSDAHDEATGLKQGLEARLRGAQYKNELLSKEIVHLQNEYNSIRQTYLDRERLYYDAQKKIAFLENQLESLVQKAISLSNELEHNQENNERLLTQLTKNKQQSKELAENHQAAVQEKNSLKAALEKANANIYNLHGEFLSAKEQIDQLNDKLNKAQGNLSPITEERNEAIKRAEKLEIALDEAQNKSIMLQDKIALSEKEIKELSLQQTKAKDIISAKENELNATEEKIANLKKEIQNNDKAKDSLEENLEEATAKITSLKQQLKTDKQNIAKANRESEFAKKKLIKLAAESKEIGNERKQEQEEAATEIANLKQKLEAAKAIKYSLEDTLESSAQEIKTLQKKLILAEKNVVKANQINGSNRTKIEELTAQFKDASETSKKANRVTTEKIADLNKKLDETNTAKISLNEQLSSAKIENETLKAQLKTAKDKTAKVIQTNETAEEEIKELTTKLAEANNEIQKASDVAAQKISDLTTASEHEVQKLQSQLATIKNKVKELEETKADADGIIEQLTAWMRKENSDFASLEEEMKPSAIPSIVIPQPTNKPSEQESPQSTISEPKIVSLPKEFEDALIKFKSDAAEIEMANASTNEEVSETIANLQDQVNYYKEQVKSLQSLIGRNMSYENEELKKQKTSNEQHNQIHEIALKNIEELEEELFAAHKKISELEAELNKTIPTEEITDLRKKLEAMRATIAEFSNEQADVSNSSKQEEIVPVLVETSKIKAQKVPQKTDKLAKVNKKLQELVSEQKSSNKKLKISSKIRNIQHILNGSIPENNASLKALYNKISETKKYEAKHHGAWKYYLDKTFELLDKDLEKSTNIADLVSITPTLICELLTLQKLLSGLEENKKKKSLELKNEKALDTVNTLLDYKMQLDILINQLKDIYSQFE